MSSTHISLGVYGTWLVEDVSAHMPTLGDNIARFVRLQLSREKGGRVPMDGALLRIEDLVTSVTAVNGSFTCFPEPAGCDRVTVVLVGHFVAISEHEDAATFRLRKYIKAIRAA